MCSTSPLCRPSLVEFERKLLWIIGWCNQTECRYRSGCHYGGGGFHDNRSRMGLFPRSFPCAINLRIASKAKAHPTCYCGFQSWAIRPYMLLEKQKYSKCQSSPEVSESFKLLQALHLCHIRRPPVTIAAAILFDYSVSTSPRMCVSAGPDAAPLYPDRLVPHLAGRRCFPVECGRHQSG